MIFVAVVGPSGSGKTTLCDVFRERGVQVHELDKVAKRYYGLAAPEIKAVFGSQVINEDGSVNTIALREIVFASREAMDKLNDIMLPLVWENFLQYWVAEAAAGLSQNEGKVVVFDAPILFETSWWIGMDYIIFVDAPLEERINRLVEKRRIPREIAEKQAAIFNYDKVKLNARAVKIDCVGDMEKTKKKLALWLKEIVKYNKEHLDEEPYEGYRGWANLEVPESE